MLSVEMQEVLVTKHTFLHLKSDLDETECFRARPRSHSDSCLTFQLREDTDTCRYRSITDESTQDGSTVCDLTDDDDRECSESGLNESDSDVASVAGSIEHPASSVPFSSAVPPCYQVCYVMVQSAEAVQAQAHISQRSIPREMEGCDMTTVMLRNIPNNLTRTTFLEILDKRGFAGHYDFVYLPVDFNSQANLGYAFINFISTGSAMAFWDAFDGFSWDGPSEKVGQVIWCTTHQGLQANLERYRNSPLMHDSVAENARPALFRQGVRCTFPPPTKSIRAPHRKNHRKKH